MAETPTLQEINKQHLKISANPKRDDPESIPAQAYYD